MFREKEMTQAINKLVGLYTPEDCEGMDMKALMEYAGCDMSELCRGLRNNVETVYQYSVSGDADCSFEYRGKELFEQRSIQVGCSDVYDEESKAIKLVYRNELWLLEDMTFAIVRCVHLACEDNGNRFETDYRSIVKRMEGREDVFLSPEILIEELMMMCVPVWEDESIIYEM